MDTHKVCNSCGIEMPDNMIGICPKCADAFDDFDVDFDDPMDVFPGSHYLAANTLGYFFDDNFPGTIQEYYDNTVPHR